MGGVLGSWLLFYQSNHILEPLSLGSSPDSASLLPDDVGQFLSASVS